jgi:hypothetical protein
VAFVPAVKPLLFLQRRVTRKAVLPDSCLDRMDVLVQKSTKKTIFTLLELGCAARDRLLQFIAAN